MAAAAEPQSREEGCWLDIAECYEELAAIADRKAKRR
jgi:hypothetical protein